MGKVSSFSLRGFHLYFISGDHLPPHFHAEHGSVHVKVRFGLEPPEIEALSKEELRGKDRRELMKLASRYRAELLEEWETKVRPKDPGAAR